MSPEALLGIRFILHAATIAMLAGYCNPYGNFRLKASMCAGLIMASSGWLLVQILTTWDILVASQPQPGLVLFVFSVFLPILLARGNMATVLDWLDNALRRWNV